MYQIDNSTAATTQPAATAAGTAGFFTDGNPATGTAPTIVPAEWLNAVMMELSNVVTGAGMTLSKPTYNQVLSAIKRLGQTTVILADTGAANAYTATNAPPLVAGTWVDGVVQQVKIAHANTGASTYAPDGLTAIPIYGLGLQPLQGGELALNGTAVLMHATIPGVNSGNPICVLMECAGGAQQVAPATQSKHAPQMGQVTGVVGSARNLKMSIAAANASATLTADEIVVETALGGIRYCLANFSNTVNLGTTGAGGMDTGSAPVSGYVALYAIYNPTTGASALLATNATSSAAPSVYGGANMPSGYTASALVSVWATNGSGQFSPGLQIDRLIGTLGIQVLSTSTQAASFTSLSIASAVPPNARKVQGIHSIGSSAAQAGLVSAVTGATSGGWGVGTTAYNASNNVNTDGATAMSFTGLPIATAQTIFYSATSSLGTMSYQITITGYEF